MKNKHFFIIILLSLMLSLPFAVSAENGADVTENNNNTAILSESENINLLEQNLEEDIIPEAAPEQNSVTEVPQETPHKKPISKRHLAKMFLKMMLGVVISSLTIYILLSIYNNFCHGIVQNNKDSDIETSLEVPDDTESAIKVFLEKTKW